MSVWVLLCSSVWEIPNERYDFVHKINVVLKELRETLIALKIIHKAKLYESGVKIRFALNECKANMEKREKHWGRS